MTFEIKQAGAELCQGHAQVGLPAEAELILTVEFHGGRLLNFEISKIV